MLRDVLLNLLMNACQAGTEAPIEVRVSEATDACTIEIADRGVGLTRRPSFPSTCVGTTRATQVRPAVPVHMRENDTRSTR